MKKLLLTLLAALVCFSFMSCQGETPIPEQKTIVLQLDGGTALNEADESISFIKADVGAVITLPTPTKTNYIFKGWYTNSGFTGSPVTSITVATDITYYAKWEPVVTTYTVLFMDGANKIAEYTNLNKDDEVVVPTALENTATHNFAGWGLGDAETPFIGFVEGKYKVTETVTFNAIWTEKSATFTVVFNNGTIEIQKDENLGFNSEISIPSDLSDTDTHTFEGWGLGDAETAFTGFLNGKYTVTGNATFKAVWKLIPTYTVTFKNGTTLVKESSNHKEGSSVDLPQPLNDTDTHTFGGWALGDAETAFTGFVDGKYTVTNENVTFNALWNKIPTFTVVFKNGETVVEEFKDKKENTEITIPEDLATTATHVFIGWKLVGSDDATYDFKGTTYKVKEDATFTAVWELIPEKCSVVFKSGETTIKSYPEAIFNSYVDVPTEDNLTAEGTAIFMGWALDNATTPYTGFENGTYKAEKPSVTFNALWGHTVTFMNGTKEYSEDVLIDGSIITAPEESPTKGNSNFYGWNTAEDGSGTFIESYEEGISDDVTFHAIWGHKVTFMNGTAVFHSEYIDGETVDSPAELGNIGGRKFKEWNTKADGTGTKLADFTLEEDTTFYAVWTYTVTFNDGVNTSTIQVVDGTKASAPSTNPTSSNQGAFSGWNTKADGTGTAIADLAIEEATTFHAVWKYTLTLNINDGVSTPLTKQFVKGTPLTTNDVGTPNDPEDKGRYFLEWNTASNGRGTAFVDNQEINSNITFYAIWGYEVIFMNGENEISSDMVIDGSTIAIPSQPEDNTGRKFKEWNTKVDGTGTALTAELQITDDITFIAVWTYTLTFNDGVNSNTLDVVEGTKIPLDDVADPTDPTEQNREFIQWNTSSDGEGTTLSQYGEVTKDETFYALWLEPGTVIFMDRDGTVYGTLYGKQGEYVYSLTIDTPTKEHYSFYDWALEDGRWKYEINNTVVDEVLIFYASWTGDDIDVKLYDFDDQSILYRTDTFQYGTPLNNIAPDSWGVYKNGYEFDEWVLEDGTLAKDSDLILEDTLNLYATWIGDSTYLILANYTGSTDFDFYNFIGQIGTYNGTLISDLNIKDPERSGDTFIGWYVYDKALNDIRPLSDTDKVSSDLNDLYAVWESTFRTINFSLGSGGSLKDDNGNSISSLEIITGTELGALELNTPTRTGWIFAGWTNDNKLIHDYYGIESDITLTAKWLKPGSIIFIDEQDNTVLGSPTFENGAVIKSSDLEGYSFTKDGYTFDRWVLADGTPIDETDVAIDGVLVLYAEYSVESVTKVSLIDKDNGNSLGSLILPVDTPVSKINHTVSKVGYNLAGWELENGTSISNSTEKVTDGLKLYATWNLKDILLVFADMVISEEGMSIGTLGGNVTAPYGALISDLNLADPKKDGFEFAGWFVMDQDEEYRAIRDDEKVDDPADEGYMPLIATWKESLVTITFDTNGGSLKNAKGNEITSTSMFTGVGSNYLNDFIPKKDGYVFSKWEITEGELSGEEGDQIMSDLTVKAVWVEEFYTITFELDDGTLLDSSGDSITSLKVAPSSFRLYRLDRDYKPTKEGYVFNQWYYLDQFGGRHGVQDAKNEYLDNNITVYADFREAITISFDLDGATASNYYYVRDQIIGKGDWFSFQNAGLTKNGYVFAGWYYDIYRTKAAENMYNTFRVYEDTTFYAKWVRQGTVQLIDSVDGTILKTITGKSGEKIATLELPETFIKDGFTFKNWSLDSNYYNPVEQSEDIVEGVVKIYALWTGDDIEITVMDFETKKEILGTVTVVNGVNLYSGLLSDFEIEAPADNLRAEWVLEDGTTLNNSDEKASKDMVFYLKWVEKTFQVSFYDTLYFDNCGYFTVPYGTPLTDINVGTLTQDGDIFLGWVIRTEDYKYKYITFDDLALDNQTVYAVWESNKEDYFPTI